MELRERLSQLMDTYFAQLWSYLFVCTASAQAADELAHHTLAVAAVAIASPISESEMRLWLYSFARLKWAGQAGEQVDRVVLGGLAEAADTDTALCAAEVFDSGETLHAGDWRRQLFRLPVPTREVAILYHACHLSLDQVASVVRRQSFYVRLQLRRGRAFRNNPLVSVRTLNEADVEQAFAIASRLPPSTHWAPPARRQAVPRWRSASISIGAVAVLAAASTWSMHLRVHAPTHYPAYAIAVAPNSVTHSQLDTRTFRQAMLKYLRDHNTGPSSQTPFGALSSTQPPPANSANGVQDLAVRWSQTDFGRYGYALVSYRVNGQPRAANVFATYTVSGWAVQKVSLYPFLTLKTLSSVPLYPSEWETSVFQSGRQIAFVFISGLVVDPAIARVTVTTQNGQRETAVVTGGVFGFEVTDLTGHLILNSVYKIKAYNQQGQLVYAE